ncbi:hypothetical protein QJS04_geneDACA009300 [Acorus gramineus]|uniref:Uncharacterized protein n=1 Tax=Acorus gramineus TaxID=55184 RepID=A0AAV9A2E8_ACOGR|nr:hypothetical protein QJS04_geneDACA009300 [Acorus gramineus]
MGEGSASLVSGRGWITGFLFRRRRLVLLKATARMSVGLWWCVIGVVGEGTKASNAWPMEVVRRQGNGSQWWSLSFSLGFGFGGLPRARHGFREFLIASLVVCQVVILPLLWEQGDALLNLRKWSRGKWSSPSYVLVGSTCDEGYEKPGQDVAIAAMGPIHQLPPYEWFRSQTYME